MAILKVATPGVCRFGIKLPRYQQIVNALTWMSHSQTLRRVSREYVIDLYLRPPVSRFRLMDFHLMDRIVRDANRYSRGPGKVVSPILILHSGFLQPSLTTPLTTL